MATITATAATLQAELEALVAGTSATSADAAQALAQAVGNYAATAEAVAGNGISGSLAGRVAALAGELQPVLDDTGAADPSAVVGALLDGIRDLFAGVHFVDGKVASAGPTTATVLAAQTAAVVAVLSVPHADGAAAVGALVTAAGAIVASLVAS